MPFLGSFILQDMFLSLQVFAFEGQNMNFAYLHSILLLKLFASIVGRFLSRILYYLALYIFLLRRRSFTSRKLYVSRETFFCFLQLSDRAYVPRARCIGLFLLLVVLAPCDSNVAVYAQ